MNLTYHSVTRYTVGFSIWQLPNGRIHIERSLRCPAPGAVFLLSTDGIPALDTIDGWPRRGDAWTEFRRGREMTVVALADGPGDWAYGCSIAGAPTLGYSLETGFVLGTSTRLLCEHRPVSLPLPRANYTFRHIWRQIPNHHSVAFDAHSFGRHDSGTSLSWSHTTTSNANRYIGVFITNSQSTDPISTVKYANVSMDLQIDAGTSLSFYDLWGPATGANNVAITTTGGGPMVAGAQTMDGVDQASPRTSTTSNSGTSTSPSFSGLTSASDEICISATATDFNGVSITTDGTWTQDDNTANVANDLIQSTAHKTGAASIGRTDTITSNAWEIAGVAVNAGGAIPAPPLLMLRSS